MTIPTDDEYEAARTLIASLGRPLTYEDDDDVLRASDVVEDYERAHEGRE